MQIAWAKQENHRFQETDDGFAISPGEGTELRWRIEWGDPQRQYVSGKELRVRVELATPPDMRLMFITRGLMVQLEQALFDQSIEGNQTHIDEDLPPEVRWLLMFPKVPGKVLGDLRERFGCVATPPSAAQLWLNEHTTAHLKRVADWLPEGEPFTLTVQKGRLTLRAQLQEPQAAQLSAALALVEVAHASALRVGQAVAAGEVSPEPPTSWGALSTRPSTLGS
jgi:hypothetical protein